MNKRSLWFAWLILVIVLAVSVIFDFPIFAYFIALCILGPILMILWYIYGQPKIDQKQEFKDKKARLQKSKSDLKPLLIENLNKFVNADFKSTDFDKKTIKHIRTKTQKQFKDYQFFDLNEFEQNILIGLSTIAGVTHLFINRYSTQNTAESKKLNEFALNLKADLLKNGYKNQTFFISVNDLQKNSQNEIKFINRKIYKNNPTKRDFGYVTDEIEKIFV